MSSVAFDLSFTLYHHLERGVDFMYRNMHQAAVEEFDNVLLLDPENKYARWDRCMALLALGDYDKGLPEHDWAWKVYDWRALGPVKGNVDRILNLPVWKGQHCHLILFHEMGNGDAIMWMRFLSKLVSMNKSVTVVVKPELVTLLEGYGANVVGSVPENVSAFDAQATLFNSVWIAGLHRDIPKDPYVKENFNFSGGKIGVVWSGVSQKKFTCDTFLAMLNLNKFYEVFSLQKNSEDIYVSCQDVLVKRLLAKDFKETASLMAEMDCVVTVDTASAHLAGAMGHPNAHVIMPFVRDWRWWHKDWWYPTLNIYPQDDPSDWVTPFERINRCIS